MNIDATKGQTAFLWLIGLLLFASLSCAQAGEVLTPEEATERARLPVDTGREDNGESQGDLGGEFQAGDQAELTGRSFLVNILDQPAGKIVAGQERGVQVTVEQVVEEEDELWYRIQAPTGSGWVRANNLLPVEEAAGSEAEGEDTGDTAGSEAESEDTGDTAGQVSPGDTVYLQGQSFLVNLLAEPGGRIVGGQERGAAVVVIEVTEQDGTLWYYVDAPGGEGWVAEENITTEAP